MNDNTSPILVLGSTGKTGRRIVERLQSQGIAVRAGSRAASPAFDWEDPSTWHRVLKGARAVYISYYPDIAVPGAPQAVESLTKLALELGVRRIVLLSGRGEEEAQRAEAMLQASGADWTILRCSWFMQNFSEGIFLESLRAGAVSLPVDDALEPFVDVEDIADVAVAALTDARHVGQLYELTGPRMLTFAQAVHEIGDAAARDIAFTTVPMETFARTLLEQRQPAELVDFLRYLFGEVLDGRNAHFTDGVQRALGRAPRDFGDYARRTALFGCWQR